MTIQALTNAGINKFRFFLAFRRLIAINAQLIAPCSFFGKGLAGAAEIRDWLEI